jgi:hypothetical protein
MLAQLGNLVLRVLIDSGSTRSLISLLLFKRMQLANPSLCLRPVSLQCFTASGHKLDVFGEVELPVKIQGFSWKFTFLVAHLLSGAPIFGVDFMKKTRMVLDVQARHVWFAFAPDRRIELADAGESKFFCARPLLSISFNLRSLPVSYLLLANRFWLN